MSSGCQSIRQSSAAATLGAHRQSDSRRPASEVDDGKPIGLMRSFAHPDAVTLSYWVNFARTGDPNGPGLPAWPAYDAGKDQLMHFSDKAVFDLSPIRKSVEGAAAYYSGE